ncbi:MULTISPECIES: branched-chain amino acid ABC transporter substrate-binding protein [unclassified Streptomyces]|uniref:branched-chain amino acid ABC transporter substrate-binding protein n=1 Tax=unclassified Streptomyces TaxID=2593676 RepID=UPI002E2E2C8E|nr:branched-chain amino acid ABC transporter substrate-binding protein [Streptomyces sp. NBC_01423]WSX95250.1 branched-chain amino acid ABC transporter substrate-binding protein [Streptomyces sp. NBC_00891]WSY09727.1 branched-chain amino acid ABC transporter substrate-binding protein [Streptomyces sp. NBC_00890]WSZ11349.1 branched-chain amino acid ABC transporter substrate-binding protein [Streptomyces sp. NBC_00869]WSZ27663.1 branched-chain amino acid ABC transporter substrate-binding protein 
MLILTTVLTTGALTLTACGSRDDDNKSDGNSSSGNTTVVIGVDAPLTGDLSALGLGIKNSADLAVNIANKKKLVPGVTFKVQPLDDQAQPSVGGQNAQKFIDNKDVLGVVGPLNSSVSQSMQKPLNDATLTQVSPANTGTELTQGNDWKTGDKKRPFKSFFRTATTDQIQGAFAAKYLYNNAKIKQVYLIDDQKTYGAGLAASFKATFTDLGGKIVGSDHVNPDDRDFNAVVTKVKRSGAKAVYYGGEYPAGAPLSQQLKDSVKIPLMGGDGMYSADFIKLNKKAQGDIATSVGKPVEELDSAKQFIADYKTAGYKDAYEAYGGGTYDATWSIIEAVKIAVADNDGKLPDDARAKVLDAMSKVKFDGVTGPVSFDEYGDTTNTMMTAYQVDGGKWVSKLSEAYKP